MQCRQRDIEIEIRIFYGIKSLKENPAILISKYISLRWESSFYEYLKSALKFRVTQQQNFRKRALNAVQHFVQSPNRFSLKNGWTAAAAAHEGDARVELLTWTNNRLMTCKYGEANQAAVLTGHEKRPRAPFVSVRECARERGWGRERVYSILSMYLRARPAHMHRARTYLMVAR